MKIKMKNRSHRYDIDRPRSRHGHKYNKNKFFMMLFIKYHDASYVLSNNYATFEAQFIKKLSKH